MFILRLDYDTGLRVDLGYRDRDRCVQARDKVDKGDKGRVLLVDDHGHEISVRVERLLVSSVVDVKAERIGQVEVGVAIEAGSREALDLFDLAPRETSFDIPPAQRDRVAFDGPVARPRFSG